MKNRNIKLERVKMTQLKIHLAIKVQAFLATPSFINNDENHKLNVCSSQDNDKI